MNYAIISTPQFNWQKFMRAVESYSRSAITWVTLFYRYTCTRKRETRCLYAVRHVDPQTSLASNKLVNHKSETPKYITPKPVYIGRGILLRLAFCHVRSFGRGTPQQELKQYLPRDPIVATVGAYVAEIISLRVCVICLQEIQTTVLRIKRNYGKYVVRRKAIAWSLIVSLA